MPTLEDQITRLADAAFERTEPVAFDPLVHRTTSRPWTSPVGLAAGLLLTAALAGLLAMVWFRDEPEVPAPAATIAPPPAVNEPTVTYPVDEEWLVPTELPQGMQYEIAQRVAYEGKRLLSYLDPVSGAGLTVELGDQTGLIETTGEIELGGRTWRYLDEAADRVAYETTVDGVDVTVHVSGLAPAAALDVVASLAWRPATDLPRPPLELTQGSVLVATADQDGAEVEMRVDTDGVAFTVAVGTDEGFGAGIAWLRPGEVITLGSASGPQLDRVAGGRESESLVHGLARADVATVAVELSDGRTVSAPVQDLSGRFVENFYLVAVPTRTEGGFELTEAIVALDVDGNELFRAPYPPG